MRVTKTVQTGFSASCNLRTRHQQQVEVIPSNTGSEVL